MSILSSFSTHIHIVQSLNEKATASIHLKKLLDKIGYKNYVLEKDIKKVKAKAIEEAIKSDEILLVCGSFYVVGDILST